PEPEHEIDTEAERLRIVSIEPLQLTVGSRPYIGVIVALDLAENLSSWHRRGNVGAAVARHVPFGFKADAEQLHALPQERDQIVSAGLLRPRRNEPTVPVEVPKHTIDVGILGADALAQIVKVLDEDRVEVSDGRGLFVVERVHCPRPIGTIVFSL